MCLFGLPIIVFLNCIVSLFFTHLISNFPFTTS